MTGFKCEHCKNWFEGYPPGVSIQVKDLTSKYVQPTQFVDLCEHCQRKTLNFVFQVGEWTPVKCQNQTTQ